MVVNSRTMCQTWGRTKLDLSCYFDNLREDIFGALVVDRVAYLTDVYAGLTGTVRLV
jgi:hypothetical protein